MTKIKKALLSVLCCFALIFCSAFVFTACTRADMTAYNITIDEAIQSGWVEVIGDPIAGEEITIVLNPGTGYEIVPGSLKVNGEEVVGNTFIMPEGNVNVTAKFKKINYAVSTGDVEHGTVDIEIAAHEILSGETTEWGTKVTLTPVPEKGYECTHLEVLNGGLQVLVTKEGDKYSFNMPQGNITINATFEKITYSLTKASEHGTFTIPATANYGDTIEVTGITPDAGYLFSKIKVNGNTISGTTFTMPAQDTTVTVEFKAIEYDVSKTNPEHGKLTLSKTTANYGDTITVTVTPDAGYTVSAIKVNGEAISGNSFVVREDSVVTVELTANQYSITVDSSENGSVNPNKTTAIVGEMITLTISPNATYNIETLTIKNGDLDIARSVDGNTVTFVMPAGNVTISATFTQTGYRVNVVTCEGGSVIVNPVTAMPGTNVYITWSINEGYDVDGESGVFFGTTPLEIQTDAEENIYFVMPDGEVEVRILFVKETYSINKNSTTNGSYEVSATRGSVGDVINITCTPDAGYELNKITIIPYTTGNPIDLDPGVTSFVMPAGRVEVYVSFRKINYTITRTGTSDHGTFEIQDTAKYGEEVVITSNPEAGYEATYTVMCGETPVVVTNNKFTMPAGNVTISVNYSLVSYTITIDEENIENGSVGVVPTIASLGDEITITAEPDERYSVKGVAVLYDSNGDGIDETLIPAKTENENEYVFDMIAYNVKVRVYFGVKSSIAVSETTNGTVETDVAEAFEGDTVTITTTPSAGYSLKSLKVNNGTVATTEISEGIYTFSMPAEQVSVNAEFEEIQYTITKNETTNGSFTVQETATEGENVTISVTPATGYELNQILVDGVALGVGETSFIMPANDVTISVTFKIVNYTITKNSTTNGSFTVSKTTANYNDEITITVIPDTGYELDQILVDGVALEVGTTSFTMPAKDVTVSVTFKNINYTINKSETTNGSFTVQETATYGENVTISVTPATGYELDQILVDEVALEVGTTSFTMPAKDVTVSVTFKNINYTINKSEMTNGSFNVKETATYGETVTITVTPDTGYELDQILVDGVALGVGETSFIMPAKDVTVSVTFKIINYTITKNETTNGSFTVQETATYGENVTISVTPATGYELDEILVNGVALGLGETSFTMPANDVTVSVTFKIYTLKLSDITYTTIGTDLIITGVTATATTYAIPSTFVIDGITYTVVSLQGTSSSGIDIDAVKIVLPSTLTCIDRWAFYNCINLTSITIPNTVIHIGDQAFRNCTGLTSVTIGSNVRSIGKRAFYICTGLTSVIIPDSVTSIDSEAFSDCTSLVSVTIGSGVTSIGDRAFSGCTGLTSITIGNSVTSIGDRAFISCKGLTSIVVAEGNTTYTSGDGANCIIEISTNKLVLGCKNTIIPNTVTSIGDRAFYNCPGLTSIIIPDSVTSVGINAFGYCTGLTSIILPGTVTSVGDSAFFGCTCLTTITFESTTPPTFGSDVLSSCTSLTTIYVPAGTKDAYVTALGSSYASKIVEKA